jgi:putative ABC transport system permease protein
LAGLTGLVLGAVSLGALRTFLPLNLHLADTLRLDTRVLAYTLMVTLAAGIVTGLVPALAALRSESSEALTEAGGRSTSSLRQRGVRGVLVIAEIAAAMVLLVGSTLLIRTFLRLAYTNLGFGPKGVLTLKVAPSPRKYPDAPKRAAFYSRILENGRSIPGVQTAAIGGGLPLIGTLGAAGVGFEGRPAPPLGGRPSIPVAGISSGYFQALQIPLLRGRVFAESDRQPAPLVAIVNQAFAQEFFPGQDALGKRIEVASRENLWREIVGIVGNVRQQGRRKVDPFQVYVPFDDSFEFETFLILKSDIPPSSLVASAASAVHAADPAQPVFDVSSMEDRLSESLSSQRANMSLMAMLAGLALMLATIGIAGVIAYFVNSRLPEIAIRIALGASRGHVVGMVLRHAMALAIAGIAVGIVGALMLTRTLGSVVDGIGRNDPLSFVAAAVLFAAVAACATAVPARLAARVDPMVALRRG